MNVKLEHKSHLDHEYDWPLFLTPELRAKLIEAKTARVLASIKQRERINAKHLESCRGTHCECR